MPRLNDIGIDSDGSYWIYEFHPDTEELTWMQFDKFYWGNAMESKQLPPNAKLRLLTPSEKTRINPR